MFAAATVLAVAVLAGADTVGPVSGTVRTADGRPAPQVLVMVRDSVRGVSALAVTDRSGKFRLPGPDSGSVTVVATTADGSRGVRTTIASRGPAADVELVLAPFATPLRRAASAAWLALLPNTEQRRRLTLDCTGCHQFDETRTRKDGAPRSVSQWAADVQRMLGYAGPNSSFPVISAWAEGPVAEWLVEGLAGRTAARGSGGAEFATDAVITEYDFPVAGDLPHDLAIERSGRIVVTGMFSHAMYRLDPDRATFERIEIPVPQANPRAVELDDAGNWWVLLGGPGKVGRYDVGTAAWRFFDIGMYPHSIALGADGMVWFNGHFTRDPEQIGRIDPASGQVQIFDLPAHRSLRSVPGGPIPYEQRVGPDGRVWISELQGNRMIAFDPRTRRSATYALPTPWSGPRRFDIDAAGIVWIPAYAANALVRLDPVTGEFTEIPMPVPGATPYIARVEPSSGDVWIGTSAADAVFRYDPAAGTFATYPLASQGALIRHLVIDPVRGDVWLAYGASPGRIPARVARIRRTASR
jgi:streptogramin lyase